MAAGAVVFDCRPPLMPVSLDVSGIDMPAVREDGRRSRYSTKFDQHITVHGRGDPAWSVIKCSAAVLCGTGALGSHLIRVR